MPEGINLLELFSTAGKALQNNQSKLNQADSYNHNHGDNMVQIFDVITQAMKEKKTADAPTQLEYAAQLLRQKSNSGSANVLANGLAQAAQQVTGKTIPLEGALGLLQTVLNGGKAETKSADPADLLGSLLSGGESSANEKEKETDWLGLGLSLLKTSKDAGIDLGALAQSLVSGTEMGKSEHRSQSGNIVANAILKMLTGSSNS
jgi:hypothetical protein